MPRRRERTWALLGALAVVVSAAAEDLDAFLDRHDLRDTRVQWCLQRLRLGGTAARDAAKALAADGSWLDADDALDAEARRQTLTDVVAALPAADRAAARPRLELSRREIGRVAAQVDGMRGRPAAPERIRDATESLGQVQDILKPLLGDEPRRGSDPLSEWRPSARLLDGWCRLLQAWLARRVEGADARRIAIELERAKVLFARLVDADERTPLPGNASVDLLRSENGAEAALGLVVGTAMAGDRAASDAWQQALRDRAPGSPAERRLQAWLLALAVDAGDVPAMRRAIEAMPPRSLEGELALAAATVAGERSDPDAEAVLAAAIEAMPSSARETWLRRLAEGSGRLQALAEALRQANERLPVWRQGGSEGAVASAESLRLALERAKDAPASMRGEALRLLGWALWRSGHEEKASVAFELAAASGPALRPECLWLAAVSSQASQGEPLARRVRLLQAQRDADPAGPYAGRVTTWLSRLDGFPNAATAVASLLEVPLADAFAIDARCEAARRILLQAGTDADAQSEAGRRALRVLAPVRHAAASARWALVAASAPGVQDGETAAAAAAQLTPEDRRDPAVAAALVRWLATRGDPSGVRAAVAAVRDDARCETALRAATALAEASAEGSVQVELSMQAARSADPRLRAAAAEQLARSVVAMADADQALDPALAGDAVAVLRDSPASPWAPLAIAEALRQSGHAEEAIAALQQRSAAAPQGSAAWLQARWLLLRALESVDRERAKAMLSQHLTLLPGGGVEPWGARFRAAAERLGVKP